ncbi:hypothetical protein ACFFYR_13980 [Paraburkholderia dipogonis]|uniref:hypothetical protein n=1 Tax=Paraburkholderia dipogonis TaxID=1211383 RepID=UPI0035EC9921
MFQLLDKNVDCFSFGKSHCRVASAVWMRRPGHAHPDRARHSAMRFSEAEQSTFLSRSWNMHANAQTKESIIVNGLNVDDLFS